MNTLSLYLYINNENNVIIYTPTSYDKTNGNKGNIQSFFSFLLNLFAFRFSSRYLDGNPLVSLDDAVFSNLTSLSKL